MARFKIVFRSSDGRYQMDHHEMYKELGVEGNRLPDEGVQPRRVQGIIVRAEPKIPGKKQDGHRVLAMCPTCKRWFGFSRLGYHVPVHDRELENEKEAQKAELHWIETKAGWR